MRQFWLKKLPGFTLIELSIVMIIVGIITAAVFKGQDLLESARLKATAEEFYRYRLACHLYVEAFGYLPGNDPQAHDRFGVGVVSGSGQGIIQGHEQDQFWVHLSKFNDLAPGSAPQSKIGGVFSVIANNRRGDLIGNWLILSAQKGTMLSILTPRQAMTLKSKMGEARPVDGKLRILEGEDARGGDCVSEGHYNLSHNRVVCVAVMAL
jgi:prepilin-type N-terminal cleavage/methylation domain-containing protein